ncbi:MAG: LamG domain-containing protein, partial [Spartobacteria bacterium]
MKSLHLAVLLFFFSLAPAMPSPLDYTYGFWSGNWRRAPDKAEPDFLCIESGRYGLKWNIQNPRELRFGLLNDQVGYLQAGESGLNRLVDLPAAELEAEVRTDGRVYKMTACRAGLESKNETALANVWLWESGRIAQHYEMRELRFEDAEGNVLPALASMSLVAWPQSLAFTLDVRSEFDYANGPAPGRHGNGYAVRTEPLEIPHAPELDSKEFTVACWFQRDERTRAGGKVLFGKNHNENRDGYFGVSLGRFGQISALMNIGGGPENIHKATTQISQLDEKGEWHHAALSYDGKTMRLHVDGRLVAEKEIGLERQPGEGVLRFGRRPDDVQPCLEAIFDEVRVWNRALTTDEIAAFSKTSDKLAPGEGLVFDQTFDDAPLITQPVFKDAILTLRLKTPDSEWYAERTINGDWTHPQNEKVTLRCDFAGSSDPSEGIGIKVLASGNQTVPTDFDAAFNSFVARANFS